MSEHDLLHSPETIEGTKRGIEDWRAGRVTPRLAALHATLAKATKACPEKPAHPEGFGIHRENCICRGTGEVAMFADFREPCNKWCKGTGKVPRVRWGWGDVFGPNERDCPYCEGRRWQVRAGGMADAEAGLTVEEFCKVESMKFGWAASLKWHDPMPDRDTILAEALKLVCKVKGLEMPDVE